MKSITSAIKRMLKQQEPFPAVLMDRYWNVIATNKAAPGFFGLFVDMAARPQPRNLLHPMFGPSGMQPFIHDWTKVSAALIGRIQREAVGHIADARTQELLDALLACPGDKVDRDRSLIPDDLPMIPIGFQQEDKVLKYFSLVSTVGTPTTITSQELRIECMFPADGVTEERHLLLAHKWS